jgi:hypothetical protein
MRHWPAVLALALFAVSPAHAAEVGPLLAKIKAVGGEGKGNDDAAKAWRLLANEKPEALPEILTAFDGANVIATNYLRAAVDAIAERELNAGRTLPADQLEAFVKNTKRSGLARRVAYEWLARVDKTAPDRLLPGMLLDPGQELRRDAVARVLDEAKALLDKGDRAGAAGAYGKALSAARDTDQVELIAKQLKTLGVHVDLANQFGFIQKWWLVSPFDNAKGKGFDIIHDPEKQVDLSAVYKGKGNAEATWSEHVTPNPSGPPDGNKAGIVDLNKVLGKQKGTTAYAFTAVLADEERPVQFRVGSFNAIKVFLNGKPVISRDEYHHGGKMDQYVGSGTLRKGRNEILVKVCQNEQTDSWAQRWDFQLRICDDLGGAVPLTVSDEKKPAVTSGGN